MVAGLTGLSAVVVIILIMDHVLMELRQEHVQILPQTLEELIVQDHHVRIVNAGVRLILIRASHQTVNKMFTMLMVAFRNCHKYGLGRIFRKYDFRMTIFRKTRYRDFRIHSF